MGGQGVNTDSQPIAVSLPKNTITRKARLLLLCFFCPPIAVYLDGASRRTFLLNYVLFLCGILPGVLHAIMFVLRSKKKREEARPMRIRLYLRHSPAVADQFSPLIRRGTPKPNPYYASNDVPSAPKRPPSLQTLPSIRELPDDEIGDEREVVSPTEEQGASDEWVTLADQCASLSLRSPSIVEENPFNDVSSLVGPLLFCLFYAHCHIT